MADSYLDRTHLDGITAALRASDDLAAAGRWFDGAIGLSCGRAQLSVRIVAGQILEVGRGQGMRGATFAIAGDGAAWETLIRGRARDFSRLLYTGELRVSGDRMAFGQFVGLAARLLDVLRGYYLGADAAVGVAVGAAAEPGAAEDGRADEAGAAVEAASEGPPITGRYVDTGGGRVYAETCGTGSPVVLLHTAGLDGTVWRYALRDLARRGYQGIALDLPGHGRSDMPAGGPLRDIGGLADAVGEFCAAAGLTRYAVAGCSVGGDIALALGLRRADQVTALVACAAADHTPSNSRMFLELSQDSAGAAGWNDMFQLNCLACTGDAIAPARLSQLMWAHATASHLVGTADLIAWNNHDLRDTVHQISCPALLIHGSYDFYVSRDAIMRTAAAIPGGEFAELPEIGHYPMVEDAGLGDRIADFLDRRQAVTP